MMMKVFVLIAVCALALVGCTHNVTPTVATKPLIKKIGTIDCDLVETSPVVFKGRLYRFECVRNWVVKDGTGIHSGKPCFRFVDKETGKASPIFAEGFHLGSTYVDGDTVYVYGVTDWGTSEITVFWSKDLKNWESKPALTQPSDWRIFNNSVCRGTDDYVMAFEICGPPELSGNCFTTRFAHSKDLLNWELMPLECVYTEEKMVACPDLWFLGDYYYMVYLERVITGPPHKYETYIVRTKDLITWEESSFNPVLAHSAEDRIIANPALTEEQREHIAQAVNLNNSDMSLCEYKDKVVIYYSWGDQAGTEFLSEAVYDGSLASFSRGWFPNSK